MWDYNIIHSHTYYICIALLHEDQGSIYSRNITYHHIAAVGAYIEGVIHITCTPSHQSRVLFLTTDLRLAKDTQAGDLPQTY